jgi:hypothetical protein
MRAGVRQTTASQRSVAQWPKRVDDIVLGEVSRPVALRKT